MKKLLIIVIICAAIILGYLILFPFAFQYKFKINHPPLALHLVLNTENKYNMDDLGAIRFVQKVDTISNGLIEWHITPIKNSKSSSVSSRLIYKRYDFKSKLKFWFYSNSDFEVFKTLNIQIKEKMRSKNNEISYGVIQNDSLSINQCLCKSFASKITEKANVMNKNIDLIANYIPNEYKSAPFLIVKELNFKTNHIKFDFCFSAPKHIKIEESDGYFITDYKGFYKKSIDFKGNYNDSHFGWAFLMNLLNEKKIPTPFVETYIDNPFMGGDDKNWTSKVYFNNDTAKTIDLNHK